MKKKLWRAFFSGVCNAIQKEQVRSFDLCETRYPALKQLEGISTCALLVLAWYILQLERGRDDTPVPFVWLVEACSELHFSKAELFIAAQQLVNRGWLCKGYDEFGIGFYAAYQPLVDAGIFVPDKWWYLGQLGLYHFCEN